MACMGCINPNNACAECRPRLQALVERRPSANAISTDINAIARGRDALDDYAEHHCPGGAPAVALTGLLLSLMHFAGARGLDFKASLDAASECFTHDIWEQEQRRG